MTTDKPSAGEDTTVARVYFSALSGAFAVTEDGKEWRLSSDEIKNALNAQPLRPPVAGAEGGVMRAALEQIAQAYVDAPGWAAATPTGELVWKMYTPARDALRHLAGFAPPVAERGDPQTPVQDMWFTDRRLPILAMSGDVEDNRVLRLMFRHKVTDLDRARLVEVLNAGENALSEPVAERGGGNAVLDSYAEENQRFADRIEELESALAERGGRGARYRHKKRGSVYRVLHECTMSTSEVPRMDDEPMVIYQCETDGKIWVRPVAEFYDGRFDALATPTPPETGDGSETIGGGK